MLFRRFLNSELPDSKDVRPCLGKMQTQLPLSVLSMEKQQAQRVDHDGPHYDNPAPQ